MLKRRIVGVSAMVAAAALALSACATSASGDAAPSARADLDTGNPVIIGLDADTTGPASSTGVPGQEAAQFAVDEINAAGGILGRQVKLTVGSDESDPTKISTVTRKLADDGASAILYITGSGAITQAKSVVKELKIPAIAPSTVTAAIGEAPDNDYMFMLANPARDLVNVFCDVWKQKGYSKLGILTDNSAAIAGTIASMRPGLEKCVKIVAEESAPHDSTDLTAQVARIKNAHPDVLLPMSTGGSFEVLAQNTLGTQMPDLLRFYGNINNSPELWDLVNPGGLAKVVYPGSFAADNPRTAELEKKLKAKSGKADYQLSVYSAQAYDAVYLLKKAIEKAAGTKDAAKIRDGLESITAYQPSYGQNSFTFSFSKDKHIAADGLCGFVLSTFGKDNRPSGLWPDYKGTC